MVVNLSKTQTGTLILHHTSQDISMRVEAGSKKTNIVLQTLKPITTTGCIPSTYEILRKKLPGVFKTKCGNYSGQPFDEEVKNTEIGHMFEHILIQNLQEMKETCSEGSVKFSAVTEWDWTVNPRGMYTISIESNCEHRDVLPEALGKSIKLTEHILHKKETARF